MNRYELAIRFAGVIHLGILVAGALVPKKLSWATELGKLGALNRSVLWTHGIYIFGTILSMCLICLLFPGELVSGTPFAKFLCGLFLVFWAGRLFIAAFYFDVSEHLTHPLLVWGYRALNLSFIVLCGIYGSMIFLT